MTNISDYVSIDLGDKLNNEFFFDLVRDGNTLHQFQIPFKLIKVAVVGHRISWRQHVRTLAIETTGSVVTFVLDKEEFHKMNSAEFRRRIHTAAMRMEANELREWNSDINPNHAKPASELLQDRVGNSG